MEGLQGERANDANSQQDLKALEALVVDNPDLERLEALLDQFNIFEAIGAVRQEVRHSDFLAFLLNPQQNHGLGDTFLKRLLQKVLSSGGSGDVPVTPIDLDIWSLDQAFVFRERMNTDILVEDAAHRLVVVIENKVDSSEHTEQLQRYWENIDEHYPDWRVIGLFLTPDGEEPSDDRYLPVDYGLICQLLEGLAQNRASTLGPDVLTAITHYTQMLRRHIVDESEIADLCRRIYQKHKAALDLIYAHLPSQRAIIRDVLREIIMGTSGITLISNSKRFDIDFVPQEWDIPIMLAETAPTRLKQILVFVFVNQPNSLVLVLVVGPEPQEARKRLLDMARSKQAPFKSVDMRPSTQWKAIYELRFLTAKSYEDTSNDEIKEEIQKHWKRFVEHDLPQIKAAVRAERWIWEQANPLAGAADE